MVAAQTSSRKRREGFPVRKIAVVLVGYTVFGAGYIAYMTFIVAYLQAGGAGTVEVSAFWVVLGVAAIGGGFGWVPYSGGSGGGRDPGRVRLGAALRRLVPGGGHRG
ncbi:MAG: YbfB/YjiJ family MFS transporter, partial [Pseudonocardiaceae bacterium]